MSGPGGADALPEALPIEPYLGAIGEAILRHGALVLTAAPGAGKTSLVPPAVAEALAAARGAAGAGQGAAGAGLRSAAGGPPRVLLVEPRRVAAVAAAHRIAEVWGKTLGDAVGYRVRGESRSGPRARVEAVTPGVLVRMIQGDPGLAEAGCVILDEFHERSAQGDLAFALLAQSRLLRPELRLLAMSATMDAAMIAAAMRVGAADTPVIEVPGRSYPIEIRHASFPEGRGLEAGDASRHLARAALDLIRETGGDVLVFLPGGAEIARAVAEFSSLASAAGGPRLEAVALHGSLPLEAQRRVLSPAPGAPLRAIFATSVAETSLTVPRVRAVVDSGLARLSRFEPRTGLNRLVTEREAQDRADQRRGRAGRLGPGICLRAWPASEVLPTRTEPEILRAELSSLVLESALWGAPARQDLAWIDPPPEGAWNAARELLAELGALEPDSGPRPFGSSPRPSGPSPFGRRMAALGTEPRLAALVLRGVDSGEGWTACLAAALVSERGGAAGGDPAVAGDLAAALEGLASALEGRAAGRAAGWAAGWAAERAAQRGGAAAEALRLARSAGIAPGRANPGALGPLLAAAFPDRIARRIEYRGGSASFRIPAGRVLRASGPLAQSAWLLALDADAGRSEGKIHSAFALGEIEALAALEGRARDEAEIEWRGLEIKTTISRRVGALELGSRAGSRPPRAELAALLASRLAAEGLGILPWGEGASEALARLRFFASTAGGLDPSSLAPSALVAGAAEWLGPYILEEGGPVLDGPAMIKAVAALAPRAIRGEMDRLAPARLELPSGSSRQIIYGGPGGPYLEARVQECFGLSSQPRVGGMPLVFRLLDPGGKPLQVTSDLPGFWKGSWAQARKDLRGRYPKHEWPEDPAAAAPSRSGIKKRRGA